MPKDRKIIRQIEKIKEKEKKKGKKKPSPHYSYKDSGFEHEEEMIFGMEGDEFGL